MTLIILVKIMSKIDYKFKSQVLSTEINGQLITKLEKQISKTKYKFCYGDSSAEELQIANELENYLLENFNAEYKEAIKINNASYKRIKRLKNKILFWLLESPCIFLTLTFTDKVLSSTSAKSRRIYISRFLRQFNCNGVANIDFGNDHFYVDRQGNERQATKREHYHAILQIDNIDYSLYKYGIINGERVRFNSNKPSPDYIRLSKYVDKLSLHAVKKSTKRQALIYLKPKKLKPVILTDLDTNKILII